MSRSFGRFVPMLALCLLASLTCSNDTSAPPLPDAPGPPTHIEGVWSYYEVVGNAQHNVSCTNQGTITIARDSADLTGTVHQTGTCIINGAYADNSGSAPITGTVGAAPVRYVNLLRAGVEPDHILAITFTRKAAAEMRQRIIDRLEEASRLSEFDLARWRELKDRLGDIAISTSDAFCLSLLRDFPLEADVDPGFDLAADTDVPRLVQQSLD